MENEFRTGRICTKAEMACAQSKHVTLSHLPLTNSPLPPRLHPLADALRTYYASLGYFSPRSHNYSVVPDKVSDIGTVLHRVMGTTCQTTVFFIKEGVSYRFYSMSA